VTIRLSMAEEGLSIYAQSVPIQQVLVNLLRNSIDAFNTTPLGNRRVVVQAVPRDDGLVISVSDNGPGLLETELAKIFEPFFTTKPHGMGLGLAISRTIIADHGGKIWATANQDGGLAVHFTVSAKKELPPNDFEANDLRR